MKYSEMKESLKKKGIALREIKIGLKEAQRVYHYNTYIGDEHVSAEDFLSESGISAEHRQLHINAWKDLTRCLTSYEAAKKDYRARHIAMSLFRGKTPEQIESNYYEGKWEPNCNNGYHDIQLDINKHLRGLTRDNPVLEYEKAA